ncbi:hypothetical protein M8818_004847 [Zalaria obscura]|uniref:Uncharacterized protein n=1 Tax=Zalaria obscura TaxID=2024903 RepID=A0ACC3SBJ3_9PEZI
MPDSLQIAIHNTTPSPTAYAYITGLALQHSSSRVFLQSNGHTLYFPSSPSSTGTPLAVDCAIPLSAPGTTTSVTIPQLAGGRLYISVDAKLTFLLNPGPALVEPSVLNPSDPNAEVNFGFVEFTLNEAQLFANISYVDFAPAVPLALALTTTSGPTQTVTGIPTTGLQEVAQGLRQQAKVDGRPWDKLIVERNGTPFRVLAPTHAGAVGASFEGYYEPYVERVWEHYSTASTSNSNTTNVLSIDTQAAAGVVHGRVNPSGQLELGAESFAKPTTADIFSCNSGPFTTGPSAVRNAIIPRLAAGFVRSSLLTESTQPGTPDAFYKEAVTDHYARVVHEANTDGKGYAFAYDDVQVTGGGDLSGKVEAGDPQLLTVTVGGGGVGAATAAKATAGVVQQNVGGPEREQKQDQGNATGAAPRQEPHQHHGLRAHLDGLAQKILR